VKYERRTVQVLTGVLSGAIADAQAARRARTKREKDAALDGLVQRMASRRIPTASSASLGAEEKAANGG
jgi:hypothetical protein